MIGFDPNPARRPGLPVPARRESRISAPSDAGGAGSQRREPSPPAAPRPARRETETPASSGLEPTVAAASSRAAVTLQAELPAPRRGLRADAGERNRFRAAYARASQDRTREAHVRLTARPGLERSA